MRRHRFVTGPVPHTEPHPEGAWVLYADLAPLLDVAEAAKELRDAETACRADPEDDATVSERLGKRWERAIDGVYDSLARLDAAQGEQHNEEPESVSTGGGGGTRAPSRGTPNPLPGSSPSQPSRIGSGLLCLPFKGAVFSTDPGESTLPNGTVMYGCNCTTVEIEGKTYLRIETCLQRVDAY